MKRIISVTLVLLLVLCALIACERFEVPRDLKDGFNSVLSSVSKTTSGDATKQEVVVKRVVDGDTFIVDKNGSEIKVRLIGVDTPESVATGKNAYKNCEEGKTASKFTKKLINEKTIYLEYDVGTTDNYGRHLCYAYLEDGRMVNEILLKKGYARIITIQPNVKYADRFKDLQTDAINKKVGFWDGFEQWQE